MIRTGLLLLAACAAFAADPPLRVLILSGRNNHDWRTSTPMLRRMLETTGRFEAKVMEEPAGLTAGIASGYDVMVSDYCGPRLGPVAEKAIESFVSGGKGFVVVHAASYPFGMREVLGEKQTRTGKREPPWTTYAQMVGVSWTEQPRTGHGKRHVYEMKFTDRSHPIAQGLPESFFISDELYHHFKIEGKPFTVGEAFDSLEVGGTGKREPLLMTNTFGKGRVFHTALGHDSVALSAPGFIQTFVRGTEWAATGKVTLSPEILRTHAPDAVKALVITGGHDYDPSFDGMFEGNPRIQVNVDPHPVALNKELRKRYDVVIFYDMAREINEKQKRNLLNFAEAGKGIIVMHHALANYVGEQWWRDIAGVQYLLPPVGNSTYLHDREYIAKPVSDHSIVKGIPELYMHDETYKGMWFADNNQVLLRTSDETSDPPLVWISAYPKSRVVGIQPGHNRESHSNDAFRRLVHNAILWSAGRL